MKKQIVSLILALMLSFGYTGQIFGVNDGTYGTASSPEGVLKEDKLARSITSDEKLQEAYNDSALKYLIGQITAVYTFLDGKLTTITNADKTVRVFFNGKEKGTVKKYDNEGGDYNWTNINLDETDVQAFDNFKKTNPGANFGTYLIAAFGVTQAVAAGVVSLQNNTTKVEDFLNAGFKTGMGTEVSISLGDAPTDVKATFSSPAGKKLKTLDYQGNTTEEWVYGNNSSIPTQYIKFGETGSQTSFVVTEYGDGTDKYKDDRGNIIPAGQPAYTWETSISSTTLKSKGAVSSVASVEEKDKKRTTIYTYDAKTNQKVKETNLSTGEITTYENGKPVAVYYKAAEGSSPRLKQKIVYGNNGLIQSVINYKDTTNNEKSKIDVYSDDSRFLGSSEDKDTDEVTLRRTLRELDTLINRTGTTAAQISTFFENNPGITSFNFSYEYLKNNAALVEAVFMRRDVVVSSGTTTYSSSMGDAFRSRRTVHPEESILDSIKALAAEEAKNTNLENSEKVWQALLVIYEALLTQRRDFTVSTSVLTEERPDLDTNITSTTTFTDRRSEGKDTSREHAGDTHNGQDVDRGQGLFQNEVSEEDLYDESSGKGQYKADVITTKEYDRATVKSVSFSVTVRINDGKDSLPYTNKYASSVTTEHKVETQTTTKYYDPAVIGEAQSWVDADGNEIDAQKAQDKMAAGEPVYIKLSPKSVNMFDGAGFKDITIPQEGEEIFVKVEDQDMFNAFKDAVGTNTQVMVTGVVTNDISGKMCLEVYNTQNGAGASIGFKLDSTDNKGYAIGDKLEAMREDIETLSTMDGSWVSNNIQTNQQIFIESGAGDSKGYLDDWRTGWKELAKLVGGGN
ncbi:MAG: hypothetical protein LBS29_02040 [Endomicrobium sp.]|jgi:hypothetical protein|nr:hypothetical protein [Endomicrobium sp.]